jgi:uncharacterized protein DUF4232
MLWMATGGCTWRARVTSASGCYRRGRSYPALLVLPLTVMLLASCGSLRTQASASPTVIVTQTPTPAPTCQTDQMAITANDRGAALGHSAVEFDVRNATAQTCSLDGYPTLQVLDASQQPLTVTVTLSPSAYVYTLDPPHVVNVVPGAEAYFVVQLLDVPASGSSSCPTSEGVRVSLPGSTTSTLIAQRFSPCQGQISVSPIEAH